MHIKKIFLTVTAAVLLLNGCGTKTAEKNPKPIALQAPLIEFTARKTADDGTPEYYLFDDNPEHLNERYLADGAIPSSIAHFENLTPGIYTVFSYHHRGSSCDYQEELFYDAAFSSPEGGSFEILNIGLDNKWDWNQAWADYTGTGVIMPEYLETYNCTCGVDCQDKEAVHDAACPAIVRNESRVPKSELFDGLNTVYTAQREPMLLSDTVTHIRESGLNRFRFGGYDEPMWLMMKFRVVSGTVTFDTLAYRSREAALGNFGSLLKGPFDYEEQYKGITDNAPEVTAEFSYIIDDNTPDGAIPVTVKNMRVPEGYIVRDGSFATNVNTWREEDPVAAESDIMLMRYTDDTKLGLYGSGVKDKDNVWRFDPFHTRTYSDDYDSDDLKKTKEFGIATGSGFIPNSEMADINHPRGTEKSGDDFYEYAVLNLGNFGVTNKYIIHIANNSSRSRVFSFEMESRAGQVYRYEQKDSSGNIVADDGGNWYMKCFDSSAAVDPESETDPPERLEAAPHSSTVEFDVSAGEEYVITLEIATLTGCKAPMRNTMSVTSE